MIIVKGLQNLLKHLGFESSLAVSGNRKATAMSHNSSSFLNTYSLRTHFCSICRSHFSCSLLTFFYLLAAILQCDATQCEQRIDAVCAEEETELLAAHLQ